MAAPISLSPNFCEVQFFGENQLFRQQWNSLEDIALTVVFVAVIWCVMLQRVHYFEISPAIAEPSPLLPSCCVRIDSTSEVKRVI